MKFTNKNHLLWILCFIVFGFLFSGGIATIIKFELLTNFLTYFGAFVLIGEGFYLFAKPEINAISKMLISDRDNNDGED